ncbi:LytTR family DNA-binding domain-containing protein [Lutibacter sp. B1]|uniref:LytR/AlgR family response regulator transcription factor n=1 Tax=Lutibacter sp. B1 TaxID=2725996 RepID=UPI0014564C27|nr:LytTR family DNA-binding domain-containing protein [Lutibacter sp. B1]NLP56924.1 response regulator transcription factor [Lutibacter sp. B1]
MNILIIENERPAADKLKRLLKKIDTSITIVGVIETVEGSVNWLQNNPSPDLILLDIQLDDGICFEIFETIKVDTPIIFTTAYNKYVLQAFEVNSVDYILKPIEENELRKALKKFKTYHYKFSGDILKQIFGKLNKQYKTRFLIKIGLHYKSIPVNEICCFYILERATFAKTLSGNEYPIDNSLEYLQKIVDPDKFFRINRSCLVHMNAISDILSYSSSRLQLKLNEKTPSFNKDYLVVSREKVTEFKKWISK